jgi:hypothetical protein
MSTQDKARELLAKDRQQEHHLHETMTVRAGETNQAAANLDEKARELLADDRHHDKHVEDTMLSRSTEEIQ